MMPGSGSPALASGSPAARAQLTGLTSGVAFNNQLALAPAVAPPTSLASCSVKAKAVAAGEVDSGRSGETAKAHSGSGATTAILPTAIGLVGLGVYVAATPSLPVKLAHGGGLVANGVDHRGQVLNAISVC